MGSLSKKLKRRNAVEQKKYDEDVTRKAKRLSLQALGAFDQAYDRALMKVSVDATNMAIVKTATLAADIIFNNWSKLQKKDTRVENFVVLFIQAINEFDKQGTKSQEEIEKIFFDKWGIQINLEE